MMYTYCEMRMEAERELKRRKSIHKVQIHGGRLRPERSTREQELMQAIVDTLRALEWHERLL